MPHIEIDARHPPRARYNTRATVRERERARGKALLAGSGTPGAWMPDADRRGGVPCPWQAVVTARDVSLSRTWSSPNSCTCVGQRRASRAGGSARY
eukprot:1721865-Prymnesium_polylepis.1